MLFRYHNTAGLDGDETTRRQRQGKRAQETYVVRLLGTGKLFFFLISFSFYYNAF